MGVVFDKLSFMKRLESGGMFTRPQAETLSEALHEAVAESVATKQDLGDVRQEIALLRGDVRTGIAEAKVWVVSAAATVIAVLAAMKYFG